MAYERLSGLLCLGLLQEVVFERFSEGMFAVIADIA